VCIVRYREYSHKLALNWSDTENILTSWHLIGHLQKKDQDIRQLQQTLRALDAMQASNEGVWRDLLAAEQGARDDIASYRVLDKTVTALESQKHAHT
jgi:uncharacterized pyridoxal phosphate-containing UPF0001 family protein